MPGLSTLTEHDWRRLAETIQRGNCVLLLGPAVAADPQDPQHTPLTTSLARTLAEKLDAKLGPESRVVQRDDLAHVAQLYRAQPDSDRVDLELAVADFYKPYDGLTTQLHRELAELPFTLCINTTPDSFMSNAFRDAGKEPAAEYYHFRRARSLRVGDADPARPIVYHLLGSLLEKDSLVLTESDLLEFLVNVITKAPPLPPYITSLFSRRETSFLFVGFGFRNWYVRILLHVLRAEGRPTRSLALEDPDFFAHPDHSKTALFFEREHLIGFKLLSWEDFVTQLQRHHAAIVRERVSQAPAPSAEAPIAFLCHSHEDRDAVADLADQLQASGIRVWLDRQSLRGGDDWERLIPSVLGKVDYVVVVESSRMQERVESYVYKELQIALDRQSKFKPGYRFIIPVDLGTCAPLDDLARLEHIQISTPAGVKALTDTIRDDWDRRGTRTRAAGT